MKHVRRFILLKKKQRKQESEKRLRAKRLRAIGFKRINFHFLIGGHFT